MWIFIAGFLTGSIITFSLILTGAMMKIQAGDAYFMTDDVSGDNSDDYWIPLEEIGNVKIPDAVPKKTAEGISDGKGGVEMAEISTEDVW